MESKNSKVVAVLVLLALVGALVFYTRQMKETSNQPAEQKLQAFGSGVVLKVESGKVYYGGTNVLDPSKHELLPNQDLSITVDADTKITKQEKKNGVQQTVEASSKDIKAGLRIVLYPKDSSFSKAAKIEVIS